jgi:hypothetical protein
MSYIESVNLSQQRHISASKLRPNPKDLMQATNISGGNMAAAGS